MISKWILLIQCISNDVIGMKLLQEKTIQSTPVSPKAGRGALRAGSPQLEIDRPARAHLGPEGTSEDSVTSHNWGSRIGI